ncbi:MAG: hypothetical protein ACTSQI_17585 [Candidatus Helarchaeota archaeon]
MSAQKRVKIFSCVMIFIFTFLIFFSIRGIPDELRNGPKAEKCIQPIGVLCTSNSILFDQFYYNWTAIINGNPFNFYNGLETYTYSGNKTFNCNETLNYFWNPPEFDIRDVNNETRFYLTSTSSIWANNSHDWVWIFKNTTLVTKNIPITVYSDPEHLFNVTMERVIYFQGSYYNVWVLEDEFGSRANYEKNTGVLINGSFIFEGTNYWDISMRETNAPFPSNLNPPNLTDLLVSPISGNLTTLFRFRVNYSDIENNMPIFINLTINGTSYPMIKQNPLNTDYKNGVIYEYETLLENGTFQYYVNASDGGFSSSTDPHLGPVVNYTNINSPVLTIGTVSPLLGFNSSTLFQYLINYSDSDNNPPVYMNLTINGTQYSMGKADPIDNNYLDGAIYNFSRTFSEIGCYIYNFTASDGENVVNFPNSGYLINPTISTHNMNNIDIGWIISHGEDPNSSYSVILNDAINLGASSEEISLNITPFSIYPYEILFLEERGSSWSNFELKNLEYWIENGGSLIISGDHPGDAQVSVNTHFNVSYSPKGGSIGPSNQIFHNHFLTADVNTLEYKPHVSSINISFSNPNLKIIANTSDDIPQVVLLELGAGKILWIVDELISNSHISDAENHLFGLNILRWMSEIKVNDYLPSLSNPRVNPSSGNIATLFTFSVNYTDADNRGPIFINVTINQTSYQLRKQNPMDFDYRDGVIFQITSVLPNGTYYYYFNASDGLNNISSPLLSGPTVNYLNSFAPKLTAGEVLPVSGYKNQIFTFKVNYTDKDNNKPIFLNVTINNVSFQMDKQDFMDDYYVDGVIFEYKTTLGLGAYEFYFNTSDGKYSDSTEIIFAPIVKSLPLKNVSIAWVRSHGEFSNSSYTSLVTDAIELGAEFMIFQGEINESSIQNFDLIIINEGGSSWSSNELDALVNWVVDGGSILILGDNGDPAQVNVSSRFQIHYSNVGGSSGISTQIYHPHYTTENILAIYFPLPLSSISSESNIYLQPLINASNGKLIIGSLQYGSGKLLWILDESLQNSYINYANNIVFVNNSMIWLSDTTPNHNRPNIIDAGAYILSEGTETTFLFYLNYTDPDGSAPTYINLTINGKQYQMEMCNKFNLNFTNEVRYCLTIKLTPGTYFYHFNASDGKFTVGYPETGQIELKIPIQNGTGNFLTIFLIITFSITGLVTGIYLRKKFVKKKRRKGSARLKVKYSRERN